LIAPRSDSNSFVGNADAVFGGNHQREIIVGNSCPSSRLKGESVRSHVSRHPDYRQNANGKLRRGWSLASAGNQNPLQDEALGRSDEGADPPGFSAHAEDARMFSLEP
jgi:hypothetical protein